MSALWGPGLWALAFVVVYALQGTGCALGWPAGLHRGGLALVWVLALAGGAWLVRRAPKGQDTRARLDRAGAWIGLISTAFTLFPLVLLRLCAAGPV